MKINYFFSIVMAVAMLATAGQAQAQESAPAQPNREVRMTGASFVPQQEAEKATSSEAANLESQAYRAEEARAVEAENKALEKEARQNQQYFRQLELEARKAQKRALRVEREIIKAEKAERRAIQARQKADMQDEKTRKAIDRYLER